MTDLELAQRLREMDVSTRDGIGFFGAVCFDNREQIITALSQADGYVRVPREPDDLRLSLMVREYVGPERYARDYEYCNAQLTEPMRKAYRAGIAAAPSQPQEGMSNE